jgi:type I restriction enzyme S subunit
LNKYKNIVFSEILTKRKDIIKNVDFVKLLRQSILQEAIQGKLTVEWRKQNPNTEPAIELLKRIKKEREQLGKENKREKHISPISTDEIPFELPQGWVWCRLGEICEIIMGQSPDGNSVNNLGKGIEFHQGKIFFTEKIIAKSNQTTDQITKIASKDSVLLCVRAPVGKVNITDRNICIGRGLCALKANPFMEFLFLFYSILTLENTFVNKAKGSIFTAISLDIVKNEIIPLPPLPEQQAIVDKLETLLEKCNQLKEEIENMSKNSKELLRALFKETFGEAK